MSLAQALGIAAAAFLTFVDPHGRLVSRALAEAPELAHALVREAADPLGAATGAHFDLSHADEAPLPDARIHNRIAPL